MQFQAFDPDIEVNGQTVLAVVKGMPITPWLAEQILAAEGISDPQPGRWYSQQAWLNAFRIIAEKVGPLTLNKIGMSIPDNADWPPDIDGVHAALASIDVAYHLNHRKGSTILMDLTTGAMEEGIGHYAYERVDDRHGTMVCENPYPCDFDSGIIEATAQRFKPGDVSVTLVHGPKSCRQRGDEACTYRISW